MKSPILSAILLSLTIINSFGETEKISPHFQLTKADLRKIISDQDKKIQHSIMENPQRFLELTESLLKQPQELFYLVDKNNTLTREVAPSATVRPSDYGISHSRRERTVSSLIIEPLRKMTEAAAREGIDILFASGYRPYEYQENLYNSWVEELGQIEADRVSAKPGTSQHQLGTAVDFGSISDAYADTEAGRWLSKKAGEFGFSLSYPAEAEQITGYRWECWHYRYITVKGIEIQREFFLNLQQYFLEFWQEKRDKLQNSLARQVG